jgi:hypothetical protein
MSSLLFNGNATSYLRIPNTDVFDFGTENFTIEWYQYQTDSNLFSRIFQVGSYPNINIGVSIERFPSGSTAGTTANFIYWRDNTSTGPVNRVKNIPRADYINKWVHFAITRSNGTRRIFMNGVKIGTDTSDGFNYNGNVDLVIGNESIPINSAAFGGYITYFTWLKGVALYTADFTVSNTYPPSTYNYILYLQAGNFDGSLGNTVENNNVETIQMVPPNFVSNSDTSDTNTSQVQNRISLTSLFTNNAQVYYKPGSLASCGVGPVRNSRNKLRRI